MSTIDILKSIVGGGRVAETHASEVLIGDEYVYKIKKPVYFGFLDYRDLKKRRICSLLETELNSRYSKNVYLGVLKIVQQKDGYTLVDVSSSLPAVEYVVKMRRIPDEVFLSYKVDNGEIGPEKMKEIGQSIAETLGRAEPARVDHDDMGICEQIRFNALDNFAHLRKIAPDLIDKRFEFVEKVTTDFLDENAGLFEERERQGYVKNGHGDLRLEHVYIENGELGLIDGIEFNREFRMNDVVSEAAFLAMEMDYGGRIELADAFLSGFFTHFDDPGAFRLLNYYRAYRAMVRAKVAVLTFQGLEAGHPLIAEKIAEYHRMMDMAVLYSFAINKVHSIVFCGIIASGKTVNAESFAKRFPVRYTNTDLARKKMMGVPPEADGVTDMWQGYYSPENSFMVYASLGRSAAEAARAGRVMLVDGAFIRTDYRHAYEKALGAHPANFRLTDGEGTEREVFGMDFTDAVKPVYIVFTAPDEVIKARLTKREGGTSVTDGRMRHFEGLKEHEGELPEGLRVDTSAPATDLNIILEYLYRFHA